MTVRCSVCGRFMAVDEDAYIETTPESDYTSTVATCCRCRNTYLEARISAIHREWNAVALDLRQHAERAEAERDAAHADAEAGRRYVAALIEAMDAEQFCALVETGAVDGIRAWLEGRE